MTARMRVQTRWGREWETARNIKGKEMIKQGMGFVYSPTRVPEDMMAMTEVPVWAWIWASPRKRTPSYAITYITGGMGNMSPRRLEKKMAMYMRTWRDSKEGLGLPCSSLLGSRCSSLLSLNPKDWDTRAYDSQWGENQDTDLDVRAQRDSTATIYLAGPHPTWRKACGKGLSGWIW